MKMAKPSRRDLDAAMDLLGILSTIDGRFDGPWPTSYGPQSLDDSGVVWGNEIAEDFGTAIQRMPFDRDDILDPDRHAEQWFLFVARASRKRLVRGFGLRHRVLGVNAQECFYYRVHLLDLIQAAFHGCGSGGFARPQPGGQF